MARQDTQMVTMRLAQDEYEALKTSAFLMETTINDLARRAIREFLSGEGRREEFDAILTTVRTKYRVALDKLADL